MELGAKTPFDPSILSIGKGVFSCQLGSGGIYYVRKIQVRNCFMHEQQKTGSIEEKVKAWEYDAETVL